MIEASADALLAVESLVENDVALVFQVRHLQADRLADLGIVSLERRGHRRSRQQVRDEVLVEMIADS
ncbi:MAG TPA: hypothetical protein VF713_16410 [Thermoanaerobaculia bacterium]